MGGVLTIREERVTECVDELKALLDEHWRELALYQDDIPLDPDYESYLAIDGLGLLSPYMLRLDGKIIGYAVYVVKGHPHYRRHKWAIADLFWIHPDHRRVGTGREMFLYIEADLRAKGVAVMHTTFKEEHPEAGFLLASMGHAMVERGYSKLLL